MSSGEPKNSNALALLRRAGTEPVMSLVRVASGSEISNISRVILRNVHLAIWSKKEEETEINAVENSYAPEQRDGAEPVMRMVRVAMKPPTTTTANNEWDESINWESNSDKWAGGLTSQGKKNNPNRPAFILREIGYDEWRKHYAKDRTGRYRGTEAPAENCILLPEDEIKWRSGIPKTAAVPSVLSEEASPDIEKIQRSDTLPEFRDVDSSENEQASTLPTQKEEALFITSDGNAASQMIAEPKLQLTSPASSDSPTSTELPTSPTSPSSRRSWKERMEKGSGFSRLRRSSTAKTIQ